MTVLVAAHGCDTDMVLAAVAPHVPTRWPVTAVPTPWGCFAVAGPEAPTTEDRWLVIGTPTADPWGRPIQPMDAAIVRDDLARYGVHASQLTAGPHVAADLETGELVRALNGIVPVFESVGLVRAVGTHPAVVSSIAGSSALLVAASCRSGEPLTDEPVVEALAALSWKGIGAEVDERLRALGRLRPVTLGPAHHEHRLVVTERAPTAPLYLPDLSALDRSSDAVRGYLDLRDRVLPDLWWRARLRGWWLHAPAFERVACDLALQTGTRVGRA